MNNIKINFYDNCAYYKCGNNFSTMEKDDIIAEIAEISCNFKFQILDKQESESFITYVLETYNEYMTINFDKKYLKNNEVYMNFFEKLIKKRKRINYINVALISSLLVIGTITLAKNDFNIDTLRRNIKIHRINKSDDYAISNLDRELEIHTGNAIDSSGKVIEPQYEHDCLFEGGKEIPIDIRIKNYCKSYLTDDKTFTNYVLQKFEYLYNDETDKAEIINLNDIYQKVKK